MILGTLVSHAGNHRPVADANARRRGMSRVSRHLRPAPLYLALILALLLPSPAVWAANGLRQGFGFNGSVSGFPTGAVALTGGGAYDPTVADNVSAGFVHAGGGFGCTDDVRQGPLSVSLNAADPGPCLGPTGPRVAGQGVRWDTAQLLHDTKFKCTGAAAEVAQTATTSAGMTRAAHVRSVRPNRTRASAAPITSINRPE